jgi:ABC-2 type transport system permease protein
VILSLRKPIAFVVKDFTDETSYKLAFALRFVNVFAELFMFYFLSQLINEAASPHLGAYGGDYFSFALIGLAFTRFFTTSLQGLRNYIRTAQMTGTLEALLSTQTGVLTIILSSMLYPFFFTFLEVMIFFLTGELLVDVKIYWNNLPVALLIFVLGIISFTSLGVMSAGFIIIFKQGDPVSRMFTIASRLLGGEVYPVSVLPVWLQYISWLLPITYALEGLRLALLQNYSPSRLVTYILALVIFDIILVPVGIIFFNRAIRQAKIDGSLSQY